MKTQLLFLGAVLLGTYTAKAQWQGTNPVWFTAGNVGVGTGDPWYKLHLVGTLGLGKFASDNHAGLTIDYIDGGSGTTVFKHLHWGGDFYFKRNDAAGERTQLYFGGAGNHYMDIYNNNNQVNVRLNTSGDSFFNGGNVGIGTTSPAAKLDVGAFIPNGALGTVLGRLGEGNSTGAGTFLGVRGYDTQPQNAKSFAIEHSFYGNVNSSINFYRGGSSTGGAISFNTDTNSEKLRITNTGSVGIGITAPQSMLDIQSGPGTSALRLQGGLPYNTYYMDITPYLQSSPWSVGYSFNLKSSDGSWNNVMSMIEGNVGIGNNNPDAKLAVSGQIHAQEVKVSITVPGPDYVFEKDYKLTSLEDIKTYIDQNKRLPEVPSAKEMEKNGVQLGEMNMLLLKKIEELTLYVIEQNKKSELQEKQNDRLTEIVALQQKQINELKTMINRK